ncbi:flavodoxin family protein [Breznakiella homolactica]|uniref:Flavodoxin family protein n=1 Tax=Breznakiella homolactica TaxID=2798577 RepID=A0A7T7XM61_9SPIR|nr:NAD(P)H-dependent oxidoreductase [Breznakiella homolactica]QQO08788.1 flavodoxin family protein [Breznakiella homolactica]
MSRKIIVLNGSPRPKGNTAALIEAFTKGAEEAGHTVTAFFLDKMNIGGCKGCYGGGKDPESPCVQKDGMDTIYPVLREADIVVLASPLYYWTISGQLKTAIDRIFAVAESYPEYHIPAKDCVLLMAAESDEYEEALHYYRGLMKHLGWNSAGEVLAQGVVSVGDITGKPVLEDARKLGASIR